MHSLDHRIGLVIIQLEETSCWRKLSNAAVCPSLLLCSNALSIIAGRSPGRTAICFQALFQFASSPCASTKAFNFQFVMLGERANEGINKSCMSFVYIQRAHDLDSSMVVSDTQAGARHSKVSNQAFIVFPTQLL